MLQARDFPIVRLAHNLNLAAEVAREHLGGDEGEVLERVLREATLAVSVPDPRPTPNSTRLIN